VAYVAEGGENKNAAGLGIKTLLVLRRRGGGWEEKKTAGGLRIKKLLVLRRRGGKPALVLFFMMRNRAAARA
jgi:hypothetical protein